MDIFKKHQLQIARKTLNMPDALIEIMGGMTKEEAKKVIRKNKSQKTGGNSYHGRNSRYRLQSRA